MTTTNQESIPPPPSDGLIDTQQTPPMPMLQHMQSPRPPFSTGNSASLYVGDLDLNVQEAQLHDVFGQYGPIESIHVRRDPITQRSMGFAFVNFKNLADGEAALASTNGTAFNGKPCRVMWSLRDLAKRRLSGGNVFIKNLGPTVTEETLYDLFKEYGTILSCKVVLDQQGQTKGYGFVHYETSEAADNAIKHVNGTTLNNRALFVGHHVPKRERYQQQQQQQQQQQYRMSTNGVASPMDSFPFTNVYVKNLMPDIKEDELRELFAGFGPITSVTIQRDASGVSRGYGFVNFERHEDAVASIQQMHDKEYIGKRLYVSRAQKKSDRNDLNRYYQGTNLYVKNLDASIDDQKLRDEFSKYGTITSARVMREERTGESKGFGFVCFSSPQEATKAVAEMNGRMVGSKAIYVALAHRRQQRGPSHLQHYQPHHPRHLQNLPYVPYGGAIYCGYPPDMSSYYPKQPYPPMPYMPAAAASPIYSPVQQQPPHTMPQEQQQQHQQPFSMETLSSLTPEMQSQILGERIFSMINGKHPEDAAKITGMLLEMEQGDLLALIDDPPSLEAKASEAAIVLQQHRADMPSEN